MSSTQLLTAQQLIARLSEPDLLVLSYRFVLEDPSCDARVYQENHIPGAYFADLEQDPSASMHKGVIGRHLLPDPVELALKLQVWGPRQDSRMVLYDDGPGAFAVRARWLLHWLDKRDEVCFLDNSLTVWKAAGLALTSGESSLRPGDLQGQPNTSLLIDVAVLQIQLGQPGLALPDVRAQLRFHGKVEPIDPVAGHTPSAQCAAFVDGLGSDGRFLPPE